MRIPIIIHRYLLVNGVEEMNIDFLQNTLNSAAEVPKELRQPKANLLDIINREIPDESLTHLYLIRDLYSYWY